MKRTVRTLSLITLILIAVLATSNIVSAESNMVISIDNEKVNFTELMGTPFISATDRTMVPIRVIIENMGHNVTWNQATKEATITDGETTAVLTIGKSIAKVNGRVVNIDTQKGAVVNTKAELIKDRTYVPIRFISEAFGIEPGYKFENNTHYISIVLGTPVVGELIKPEFEIIQMPKIAGNVAFYIRLTNLSDYIGTDATFSSLVTSHPQFNKYEMIDIFVAGKWVIIDKTNVTLTAKRVDQEMGFVYELLLGSPGIRRDIITKGDFINPKIGEAVTVAITINMNGQSKVYNVDVPYVYIPH